MENQIRKQNFKVTHSIEGYDHKLKRFDKAWGKVKFMEEYVLLFQIGELIKKNVLFSPNLNDLSLGRKGFNIKSYSYIPIDIDHCSPVLDDLMVIEFVNKLKIKPNFVYQTLSYTDENKRYRILYIMENEINGEIYQKIYNSIVESIKTVFGETIYYTDENGEVKCGIDNAMKSINQAMWGTLNHIIYSNFDSFVPTNLCGDISITINVTNNITNNINRTNIRTRNNSITITNSPITLGDNINNIGTNKIDKSELVVLCNKPWKELIEEYLSNGGVFYHNNLHLLDKPIIMINDYVEIPRYELSRQKKKDGQRRKREVYYTGLKLRLIHNDNIKPYDMLINLINWVDENIINDEDPIRTIDIIRNLDSIYRADLKKFRELYIKDQREYKFKRHKSDYISNKYYCDIHNLNPMQERKKFRESISQNKDKPQNDKRKERYSINWSLYNPSLSNVANAKALGCSEGAIRKYKKGLSTDK